MKRVVDLLRVFVAACFVLAVSTSAAAQSSPGFFAGQIPTAAQWNGYFSIKQDYNSQFFNTPYTWNGAQTFTANTVFNTTATFNSAVFNTTTAFTGLATFSGNLAVGSPLGTFPVVSHLGAFLTVVIPDGSAYTGLIADFFRAGRGTTLVDTADGTLRLSNSGGTDFNLLQFGGTTNAFPALKRVSTGLQLRSADDSVGANLDLRSLVASGVVKITPLTVAGLSGPSTVGAGAHSFVSDATQTMTAGIGAVVVGGGANNVPVYSDGTSWRIG